MKNSRLALFICSMLLIGFAAGAWFAIHTKSATYDEPYHAISAWVQWNRHDYRIDNEDPPLWQYWASLPNGPRALSADVTGPIWQSMPQQVARQWYWGVVTLYRTKGNDPVAFINRCRAMMLVLAVALGALIGYWSWRIGGAVAAVVATALFSLDPNFLAHSALMKNDIVFALALLALAWAIWKAGQKLTVLNGLLIALLCVVALTVKFSGLVAVLLVPALLGLRAMLTSPWTVLGRSITSRLRRLAIAIVVVGVCAILSYVGIWAVYGFRFRPTPEPGVYLNMEEMADHGNNNRIAALYDGKPPPEAFAHVTPAPTVTAVMFANRHGLLPQPYLAGMLFTYDSALIRPSYLLGELSVVGWWWYFPFAMLVKTPVGTLIAVTSTMIFLIAQAGRPRCSTQLPPLERVFAQRRKDGGEVEKKRSSHLRLFFTASHLFSASLRKFSRGGKSVWNNDAGRPGIDRRNAPTSKSIPGLPAWAMKDQQRWTVLCLGVPFTIFLSSAIFSHLNIGIRHVLGLYPFAFIGIGWAASSVWSHRKARAAVVILLLGVAVESVASFPNFIPFFNVAANVTAGGINLLGDSNLDWGQDLPLLELWQRAHPKEKLYLSYFGYADPVFYRLRYVPLPGGYHYDPKPEFPRPFEPCILAISATNLQGILVDPGLVKFYDHWRQQKPIAVLGGSIYLFEYDPARDVMIGNHAVR